MATIQGVYVALFGRPADPTGLAYFNGVTKNGADLSGIGDLASTQEYKDRFAGQNNTQIVNSIYQSLFNRDAEAAGLTFFVNALNNGTLNINNIAIAILDGAQGTDKTIVETKVAAADLYTSHLDTATEIGSYQGNAAAAQGRAFLAGVSTTVPTEAAVDAAIKAMQDAGAVGVTITAGATIDTLDTVNGITDTVTNTTKTTTNNNDTIIAGTHWDPVNSKIDAGLGIDTMSATVDGLVVNGSGVVAADGIKNVEILKIATDNNASGIDVSNAAQLTQLWHVADGVASNEDLTVAGLSQSATFGMKGNLGVAADNVTFADSDATSTVNLKFDGATAGTLTVSDAGTVNVSNTGTTNVALDVEAKTIVLTGDGSYTLAATDGILQTVNASAFTGKLDANVSGNTTLKAFTGGTGADTVTFTTGHSSDVKFDLGAGNDTFHINAGAGDNKAISLTGGAGSDIFYFGAAAAATGNVNDVTSATTLVKSLITITDFAKAEDSITFGATAGAYVKLDVGQAGQVNDTSLTLLEAANKALGFIGNDNTTVFTYGSDTYIVSDTHTGGGLDQGDTLIKVVGISASDLTDSNFTVAV